VQHHLDNTDQQSMIAHNKYEEYSEFILHALKKH